MHFTRSGHGAPALLFVHGYTCDSSDWQLQIAEFQKSREVVACDLRGHGTTPARAHECSIEHYGGDVAALVASLELARTVLIGHSMGCRVVLEAARLIPAAAGSQEVAGLVLIDGSRQASGDADAAERAARAGLAAAGGYTRWIGGLFEPMFLQRSEQSHRIIDRAVRLDAGVGTELRAKQMRWDAAQMDGALGAVRAPVLVIQSTTVKATGERVPMRKGESSAWLDLVRSRVPAARIEIVPDVGHFIQIEAAPVVNRLIEDFLETV